MMILNPYVVFSTASSIFEAVFDTTKTSTGSSDINTITLPITNTDGLSINWGDGVIDASNTHTYSEAGVKTVKIEGNINGWRFNNSGDRLKLIEIKNWGNFFINNDSVFYGCANLTLENVNGMPNITSSTLGSLFRMCSVLVKVKNINNWNVSSVTDMDSLFRQSGFNDLINNWNVSNVTNMTFMFYQATNFNQNIGGWDVSSVTNMTGMFQGATNFNQNIGGWDVSSVTNMTGMFAYATNFNQDISNWDIRNVTTYGNFMFSKNSSNYNAVYLTNIYNKWSVLTPVKTGITINFDLIKYNSAGQAGRDILTTTYGWTITDGGI